jgi:uncharacterized membrane protein YkvA (DUF1232 family)
MTKKTKTLVGLIALFAAVAYVALPYDIDGNWYSYIDDFFVFMAGYTFFMSTRSKSVRAAQLLKMTAGTFFIIGMLSLIALIVIF